MADHADLIERLRHCSAGTRDEYLHELTGRAADALEAQAREIERLRAMVDQQEPMRSEIWWK